MRSKAKSDAWFWRKDTLIIDVMVQNLISCETMKTKTLVIAGLGRVDYALSAAAVVRQFDPDSTDIFCTRAFSSIS